MATGSMPSWKVRLRHLRVAAAAGALLCAPDRSQAQPPPAEPRGFWGSLRDTTPAGALEEDRGTEGFWHQTGAGIKNICTSGGSDVYVPGYIWHLPYEYTEEQIARYNTTAWGVGYGRTLRGGRANHPRALFAIVAADSYSNPQYMVGYSWRARWHPGGGPFALGGGYTVLVVGREDKFNYAPLPGALPLGSLGIDRFELMGAYVPYFEVGYFFLRLNFGEGPRSSRQK
jgi:palmitoyl transferase